ncbi:hypothetical protein [Pseudanabaena sp. BC1403]|uniref:hypothetical protein n=1 Tax=Pseudanabaena sp. BC1403 TaxID=2043171 RepID=UPI0011AEC50C|nr:hypothetical protein [Pseudanabaena sp. BC1403]
MSHCPKIGKLDLIDMYLCITSPSPPSLLTLWERRSKICFPLPSGRGARGEGYYLNAIASSADYLISGDRL